MFDDSLSITSENNCTICLGSLNSKTNKTLKCNHIFHINCITEWFIKNNSCPICRSIEIETPIAKLPVNYTININHFHIRHPPAVIQVRRTANNKKIYYFGIIIWLLSILFHCCSSFYNIAMFYRANNKINNYIKHLNETELGNHNHNTNLTDVLVMFDVAYYFYYIIFVILLFKKKEFPTCGSILSFVLIITNLLIRDGFKNNTNSYLDDNKFNFDQSYYDNLMFSYSLYLGSFGTKIVMNLIAIYCILIIKNKINI